MNIVLYSLPGISKTDTPVFSSLANQELFFFGLTRQVISTGFYPPYFKNTIKVDVSDYNLTTSNWNYCSLDFNNKTYYYFIKNKRYINESIVEFDIEMDTIQTYMFNVTWINSMIERFSIRRWNPGYVINREYIRENISKGSFSKVSQYVEYNTSVQEIRNWFYVGRLTNNYDEVNQQQIEGQCTININDYTGNPERYMRNIIPNGLFFSPHEIATDSQNNFHNPFDSIPEFATNAWTCDMYLIPFECCEGLKVVNTLLTFTSNFEDKIFYGNNNYSITAFNYVHTKVNNGTYAIPQFVSGSSLSDGVLFNPFNNPLLLDNNYVHITFGDPNIRSEYPLYTLTSLELKYAYWADLSNGYRYYNLYIDNDYFNNKYLTIACNSNALKLDLKNNMWKEYIARNRATFGAAIGNMFMSLLSGGLISGGEIAAGVKGPGSGVTAIKTGSNAGSGVYGEAIKQINLQNSPSTLKATGNASAILFDGDGVISSKFYLCDDFKECCEYFEMFGYRVDWHVDTNLFTMNHRHLFNYIKVSEMNILIGDKATEENFIARFKEGIRMWDTYEFYSSLIVRQVKLCCKESPYNCEMGDCLKYDNLESWISTN